MTAAKNNAFAHKKTYLILASIAGLLLGLSVFFLNDNRPTSAVNGQPKQALAGQGVFIFPQTIPVTDVPFMNEENEIVSKANNVGKWSLLFFGYTFCPDICPTTLAVMQQAWTKLTPAVQANTQVVLVSVDPERDTPDVLKTYMDYFNPSFTAFTGKPASLRSFATQLNAVYARVDRVDENGNVDLSRGYLMDHSANIAILDPEGNYYGFVKPPFNPKKIQIIINTLQND